MRALSEELALIAAVADRLAVRQTAQRKWAGTPEALSSAMDAWEARQSIFSVRMADWLRSDGTQGELNSLNVLFGELPGNRQALLADLLRHRSHGPTEQNWVHRTHSC